MIYKGVVCKTKEDEYYVIILDDIGWKFISIFDDKKTYTQLKLDEGSCCGVKFYDGTELIDYNSSFEKKFEDIFIQIEDFGIITSPFHSLFETIRNDFNETSGFEEAFEQVFNSGDINKHFKHFKNKDFYGNIKT